MVPSTLAALADALEQATGIPATEPVRGAFAWLGVTNQSPLPVRQVWFLGLYIVAPLAGGVLGAAALEAAQPRWPLRLLTVSAASLAGFWSISSLLNR